MKTRLPAILILLIIGVAAIGYLLMERFSQREAQLALEKENLAKTEEMERLANHVTQMEEAVKEEKEAITPPEKLAEVFGEQAPPPGLAPERLESEEIAAVKKGMEEEPPPVERFPRLECSVLENRVSRYFAYLDKKDYPFPNGSKAYLLDVMDRLSKRLPLPGEVRDPNDMLSNTFHLYRALSKKDIFLIKEILRKERDTMEQSMNYFHQYLTQCRGQENFLPPLDFFYEYAHFFLSTLGGRSYLFRMEGGLRLLLVYYCAMIIHEADVAGINRYGLDIRPYLTTLESDLKGHKRLYYSERYRAEVRRMIQAYPPPPSDS